MLRNTVVTLYEVHIKTCSLKKNSCAKEKDSNNNNNNNNKKKTKKKKRIVVLLKGKRENVGHAVGTKVLELCVPFSGL